MESSAASAMESMRAAATAPRLPLAARRPVSRTAGPVPPTQIPSPCTYLPSDSFPLDPGTGRAQPEWAGRGTGP
ncbi:hypothetical protein GCM10020295_49610 [Streptomyces cinereospinus]